MPRATSMALGSSGPKRLPFDECAARHESLTRLVRSVARHLGPTLPSCLGFHRSLPLGTPVAGGLYAAPRSFFRTRRTRSDAPVVTGAAESGARSSTSAVHPIREHDPSNRSNPAAPNLAVRRLSRGPGVDLGVRVAPGRDHRGQGPTTLSRRLLRRRRAERSHARDADSTYATPTALLADTSRRGGRGGGAWRCSPRNRRWFWRWLGALNRDPYATWPRPISRPRALRALNEPCPAPPPGSRATGPSRISASSRPAKAVTRFDPRCLRSERPLAGPSSPQAVPKLWRNGVHRYRNDNTIH